MRGVARLGSGLVRGIKRLPELGAALLGVRAFVTLLAIAVAAFWVLSATRMPATDITITANVSELSFSLQETQHLLEPLAVRGFKAAGFSTVEIPQPGSAAPEIIEMSGERRFGMAARAGTGPRDSLTLDLGSLPARTGVWVGVDERSGTYKLSLRLPAGGEILATAHGSVTTRVPNLGAHSHIYSTPRTMRLVFERDALTDLTIELREPKEARLRPDISITRLDLHRLPQHVAVGVVGSTASSADSGIRPIPTLMGGEMILEDVTDKPRALYSGQQLFVRPIVDAQLLQVVLGDGRIGLILRGRVAGLRTGHAGQRDLMPTWLQYLQNQDWAKRAAAGISGLIGLLTALGTWPARKSKGSGVWG